MWGIYTDPRYIRAYERFVERIRNAQSLPHNAQRDECEAANRSLKASIAAISRWTAK